MTPLYSIDVSSSSSTSEPSSVYLANARSETNSSILVTRQLFSAAGKSKWKKNSLLLRDEIKRSEGRERERERERERRRRRRKKNCQVGTAFSPRHSVFVFDFVLNTYSVLYFLLLLLPNTFFFFLHSHLSRRQGRGSDSCRNPCKGTF